MGWALRNDIARIAQPELLPKDEASKAQVKNIWLTLSDDLEQKEVVVTDAYDRHGSGRLLHSMNPLISII